MHLPDDDYKEAQEVLRSVEPFVTQYRAHAFDLIQNHPDFDEVETKVDLAQHAAQAIQNAPNASAAFGFVVAALAEALHQLGMSDHAAFTAMLAEIQDLPTASVDL